MTPYTDQILPIIHATADAINRLHTCAVEIATSLAVEWPETTRRYLETGHGTADAIADAKGWVTGEIQANRMDRIQASRLLAMLRAVGEIAGADIDGALIWFRRATEDAAVVSGLIATQMSDDAFETLLDDIDGYEAYIADGHRAQRSAMDSYRTQLHAAFGVQS